MVPHQVCNPAGSSVLHEFCIIIFFMVYCLMLHMFSISPDTYKCNILWTRRRCFSDEDQGLDFLGVSLQACRGLGRSVNWVTTDWLPLQECTGLYSMGLHRTQILKQILKQFDAGYPYTSTWKKLVDSEWIMSNTIGHLLPIHSIKTSWFGWKRAPNKAVQL